MKMTDLFSKNISLIREKNKNIDNNLNELIAKANSILSNFDPAADLKSWQINSRKAYLYPDTNIRSESQFASTLRDYEGLLDIKDISKYHDLPSYDPHLCSFLLDHRLLLKNLKINPDISVADIFTDCHQLIAFGTGDGALLQKLLDFSQPRHLVIAITDWSEFISSFYSIDWEEVWLKYSSNGNSIAIKRVDYYEQIWDCIISKSYLQLDGTIAYKPYNASKALDNLCDQLFSQKTANFINYLGFTLDEFNMIENTVDTLFCSPKVWSQPTSLNSSSLKAIICASGPSLDQSIQFLTKSQNSHIIIASGSSYETLRKHNIRVDYICINERALNTFDDFNSTINTFGRDDATLIMSSTCPSALISLFETTIVFFRVALSPLSLFARSESNVLANEGPEAVNTSLAFATSMGFSDICFVGVDLGAVTLDKIRSQHASGSTPRTLDIETKGNLQATAFTSKSLLDVKYVLEVTIKANPKIKYTNVSNGVCLDGVSSMSQDEYLNLSLNGPIEEARVSFDVFRAYLKSWEQSLLSYDPDTLRLMWQACDARNSVLYLMQQLRKSILDTSNFGYDYICKVHSLLDLSAPKQSQIGRRIARSTIYKVSLSIQQQARIIKYQSPEVIEIYIERAKLLLLKVVDKIEHDSFLLFDLIDKKIYSKCASPSSLH